MPARLIPVLALLLLAAPAAAQTVSGTLTDEASGLPIAGAPVILIDREERERARDTTDAAGAFRVRAPGQGAYWLRAEPTGYQMVLTRPFALTRGDSLVVPMVTRVQVATLEGVTVAAPRGNRNFAGFVQRQRFGFGLLFGPEQVERRNFGSTGDFLLGLGARVDVVKGLGTERAIFRSRGRACAPLMLLDGSPFRGDLTQIPAGEIRAVEVYDNPTLIPPELTLSPFNTCGALVIWTAFGLGME